ncbi:MAG: hypothetical protein IID30_13505 [Planctomycetes bacterium]|nr:hypothetical protein [Planctomycetota bacterium]
MSSLIMSQSNGPIAVTQDGMPVFFDTTAFVDEDGFVIPAFARDYNTAIRANQIMVDTLMAFAEGECRVPPLNNRCCHGDPEWNCDTVETGSRCAMDAAGLQCAGSSTNCP